ncbi:testis-specific serine/threonine-protein kinase 3-like [Adelges cooleyi]|uniref:testis-specific serine/threonine-protein kinase 3-like n=1 Tax=Adelges cooleyi TaxID=133065 RepID=UPI00217FA08C|nr:testis-specific serine/threonine-protein kinase 3-like [Adelges cooleyi]
MVFLFYNKTLETGYKLSTTNALQKEGYIILEHISHGSYGEVRHAKYVSENNEHDLVVKIIDTHQTSKDYVTKFLPRELDILRKINHPYIIYTHSILQRKAVLFVFMAYAGKGELLQYIIREGPLKEGQTRVWFRQLALAIQYLHTMDIVHRDIKCENILITNHFTVKLTDFGFSKIVNRAKKINCSTYCCSVAYAPPEVLGARPYDGKASDIWSLGVVLYVMLNKRMPFNDTNVKLMYKQQVITTFLYKIYIYIYIHINIFVIELLPKLFSKRIYKVKREWLYRTSIENLLSDEVKTCINNMMQPETRKRWTIDTILNCEWIKMNPKLLTLNEQESLALVDAIKLNKTKNQHHLKKIESNNTETQKIMITRPPQYESQIQSLGSVNKEQTLRMKTSKVYNTKQPQRLVRTKKTSFVNHAVTSSENV